MADCARAETETNDMGAYLTTWIKGAHPVMKGKTSLDGPDEWQTVTDENKAQMRFFRVEVQLP